MIKQAIANLITGRSLDEEEAASVMGEIMDGTATPSQFGAFVIALKLKGETTAEITGLARTMRARAVPVTSTQPVVDIVGTGGDQAGTFNISTTTAFVAAGAGLCVAKHGNRAASSACGSADVLESLGIRLNLSAGQVADCLAYTGLAFMFAPAFHPAMKYAAGPRREIGVPTVFNILGPLTNPADAGALLLGVSSEALLMCMAEVLQRLGVHHALVVHGDDGLDELSVTTTSQVCELKEGWLKRYTVSPEEFGLAIARPCDLKGGGAAENATIMRRILSGETGPRRDIVLLNTAAALLAGDKATTLSEGVAMARESIDCGRAQDKLEQFIAFSKALN